MKHCFIVIITELQLSIADYVMRGVRSVALAVVAVAMTTKLKVNHHEALHRAHTVQYLIYQKEGMNVETWKVAVLLVIAAMLTHQINRYETMTITLATYQKSMSILMTRMTTKTTMVSFSFFFFLFLNNQFAISSQNSKIDFDISLASPFLLPFRLLVLLSAVPFLSLFLFLCTVCEPI